MTELYKTTVMKLEMDSIAHDEPTLSMSLPHINEGWPNKIIEAPLQAQKKTLQSMPWWYFIQNFFSMDDNSND